jgi:hypothetical protein
MVRSVPSTSKPTTNSYTFMQIRVVTFDQELTALGHIRATIRQIPLLRRDNTVRKEKSNSAKFQLDKKLQVQQKFDALSYT